MSACFFALLPATLGQSNYTTPYTIYELAGDPGVIGTVDGTYTAARFHYPSGVALDSVGNLYVADTYNSTVRKVTVAGVVTTLAGLATNSGVADGTGNAARFNYPAGLALDAAGNIYVADSRNNTIRKVTPAGVVTTLAGMPTIAGSADGTNSAAQFDYPCGVALDSATNLYIADTDNCTIRKMTPAGVVTTLAGLARNPGSTDGTNSAARFAFPYGIAVDSAANVYVADTGNSTIRVITPAGVVTTLAGLATNINEVDAAGSAARFAHPHGLALDAAANIFVADTDNDTIRLVTPEGVVSTLAGLTAAPGNTAGKGSSARFDFPAGVAVDSAGNVYVGNTAESAIMMGVLSTLAPPSRPSVGISFPKSHQALTNDFIVVTGTTGRSQVVAAVYVQLNDQDAVLATTTDAWANWTATAALTPGTNIINAYAQDTNGFIFPATAVSFQYISNVPLTVQTNGNGTVSPNDDGKLLALNVNYTLTAIPAHDWILSNWVGGVTVPYAVLSTNAAYTFTMQSNLVLQANFVTNLFIGAQGAYNGLFAPTNAAREHTNSGSINFNLTSGGVLSGYLVLGGKVIPLSGQFNPGGAALLSTNPSGNQLVTTALQLNPAGQSVQGTVTDGSFVALLNGYQDVFTSGQKAAAYEGQYTFVILGTNDPTVGPLGSSYARVTVNSSGNITLAGSLADGTAISQSSFVSKDGLWPFYIAVSGGAGSLWGWNSFIDGTLVSPTNLSWISTTNTSIAALYGGGFTNQAVQMIASPYNPASQPPLALGSGQVILDGGNLPFDIIAPINLAANGAITFPAGENSGNLVLTINRSTGVISGSFANPSNAKQTIKVNGVLLQNQASALGYFLGVNQSGTFLLDNP
jgi:sugar lactone lactonase YvrE